MVIEGSIRVRAYEVMQRAVEEGFAQGYRRAFKHTDTPPPDVIEEQVVSAIMGCIWEVFSFDTPKEE